MNNSSSIQEKEKGNNYMRVNYIYNQAVQHKYKYI